MCLLFPEREEVEELFLELTSNKIEINRKDVEGNPYVKSFAKSKNMHLCWLFVC